MSVGHIVRIITVGVLLVGTLASPGVAQSPDSAAEFMRLWKESGHADATSPAFTHWDEESEIPVTCATCHSGEGFRAFYGLDGSKTGVIDHPIPTGGVVDCQTCHHDNIGTIGSVRFPSSEAVTDVGSSAPCLTCHQGRQSGDSVANALTGMDEDAINPDLTFINPHYAAAAATLFGSQVRGAYQYEGKDYAGRFTHVPGYAQCSECHNPHTLEVQFSECAGCHKTETLQDVRTSELDLDGDGNISEGMADEIAGMQATLSSLIQFYSERVSDSPIAYAANSHPYYFMDRNANGVADADETERTNAYSSWTPRLLKAAYNFRLFEKDKGSYAHNPHYVAQILHDSIHSLNEAVEAEIPAMQRP